MSIIIWTILQDKNPGKKFSEELFTSYVIDREKCDNISGTIYGTGRCNNDFRQIGNYPEPSDCGKNIYDPNWYKCIPIGIGRYYVNPVNCFNEIDKETFLEDQTLFDMTAFVIFITSNIMGILCLMMFGAWWLAPVVDNSDAHQMDVLREIESDDISGGLSDSST